MSTTVRRALLDTSAIIEPPSASQLRDHADELAVPVIAIGELHYGITATDDPLEQTRRRQRIRSILEVFDVLPFDLLAAEYYGAWPPWSASMAATPVRGGCTCRSPPRRCGMTYRCSPATPTTSPAWRMPSTWWR
ncbi:PIN domain-containing protein [Serinicoccus sp. CNJ-927]|uniref:PIN domain-containing protein n=1 Tax=Serinicoccus sp. CNJ-927 TaxID=1904970 RepID=UPI00192D17AC|nr:PIN domain-containing protein [Serinicoccus sp. CNJ-927]